ncbi:lysophosphatidic acid acyltransferase / lysophosphatidylinositol acyltransferase protein [Dioscorea alata]|uniref:Lysophosphatidic acid acyltransferase / lysophosphatidylinositol acyltransferase protein n=1 Tax=Dioscorea alata TaxID=55571 RepID=A0ACB7UXQ6_DIOAL|nr:lysophosphatidic acid acyltransferase / lysophosphatidylinositol acyltransferase protein [Dioscorea alata]
MAIPAALVVLPLGVLFLLSGLIVNLIQAAFFVTVRPFSKNLYRRINRVVAELLWLELVWLVDWWAGVEVRVYADSESFKSMGKEHALVICNHRSDIDWLVGWILAQRAGCLGSTLAVMKKSSKFLPVIGWSMWFAEYLFLERSWAKDEITLKSGLQRLKDFPQPFWLALFVEGTRFTQAKLLAAREYAASQGLPIPRNVLIPRTKGFVSSVNIMRTFVPAIYDVTIDIPKDKPPPTMLRILKGQSSVVHVHMKRHAMSELPETDDGVAQWCRDIFVAKDALLDKHIAEGTFGEEYYKPIGRPKKSLLVVIFWSSILSFALFKFFKWSSLFSTWKGIGFSMLGLLIVTVTMHIFVLFSQSERSTPAKVAPTRPKKE